MARATLGPGAIRANTGGAGARAGIRGTKRMKDPRRLAVTLVGFCAFLQLYTPQSLLPTFAVEFGLGPAAVGLLVSATTLAVAFTAPFAGVIADRFGRRRIIVASVFALVFPTVMLAASG